MNDENEHGTKQDPPSLTEAYHKARHLLALLSAVLMTWEFLGLGVGQVTSDVAGTRLSIDHPKAIPVAIVLLIVYSCFRMGVEWWQCDKHRRELTASIVDLVAAYAIAVFAVTLYGLQRLTPFRLADGFTATTAVGALFGLLLARLVMMGMKLPQPKDKWQHGITQGTSRRLWTTLSGAGIAAVLGAAGGVALYRYSGVQPSVALGLLIGSYASGIVGALVCRKTNRLAALASRLTSA